MELETLLPDALNSQPSSQSSTACHAFAADQHPNDAQVPSKAAKACHPDTPAESPAASHAFHAAASVAIRMSDVQPRPLHWLWKYWLALGKLALLDGDPGQAKSMLLVDLAARVSSGRAM